MSYILFVQVLHDCLFVSNIHLLVYHFNFLINICIIYFLVIFLVVTLAITVNIFIYNNIDQINTNLISIIYKKFAPIYLHFPFILLFSRTTSLYIVCPIHICNYWFMQLSFKWDKKKNVVMNKNYIKAVFYTYLWSFLYCFSLFLHVYPGYCLMFSVSAWGLLVAFLVGQVC